MFLSIVCGMPSKWPVFLSVTSGLPLLAVMGILDLHKIPRFWLTYWLSLDLLLLCLATFLHMIAIAKLLGRIYACTILPCDWHEIWPLDIHLSANISLLEAVSVEALRFRKKAIIILSKIDTVTRSESRQGITRFLPVKNGNTQKYGLPQSDMCIQYLDTYMEVLNPNEENWESCSNCVAWGILSSSWWKTAISMFLPDIAPQ